VTFSEHQYFIITNRRVIAVLPVHGDYQCTPDRLAIGIISYCCVKGWAQSIMIHIH
ncbi:hypothetical protein JB92DRAFT_3014982, partial [Gautieria morchelliformis]